MANLAAFFYQNIYWKSLKNPERILKSSDFGNDNTFCLLTDKKSSEFLNNSCSKNEDFGTL